MGLIGHNGAEIVTINPSQYHFTQQWSYCILVDGQDLSENRWLLNERLATRCRFRLTVFTLNGQ